MYNCSLICIGSDIFLHRDESLMPQNPAAWSAWNFLGSTNNKVCVTYWLNILQVGKNALIMVHEWLYVDKVGKLLLILILQNIEEAGKPFFVTLNPDHVPENTLLKWSTGHPVPSVAAYKASAELDSIQGKRRIWFSGAYQGTFLLIFLTSKVLIIIESRGELKSPERSPNWKYGLSSLLYVAQHVYFPWMLLLTLDSSNPSSWSIII